MSQNNRFTPDVFSEDLISLLDAGIGGDHPSVIIDADSAMFSEDMFSSYSSLRSLGGSRTRAGWNA